MNTIPLFLAQIFKTSRYILIRTRCGSPHDLRTRWPFIDACSVILAPYGLSHYLVDILSANTKYSVN